MGHRHWTNDDTNYSRKRLGLIVYLDFEDGHLSDTVPGTHLPTRGYTDFATEINRCILDKLSVSVRILSYDAFLIVFGLYLGPGPYTGISASCYTRNTCWIYCLYPTLGC